MPHIHSCNVNLSYLAPINACMPSSNLPSVDADATAWISIMCRQSPAYEFSNDDDDTPWIESASGAGYLTGTIITGVVTVGLAVYVWHFRKSQALAPARLEEHTHDEGL